MVRRRDQARGLFISASDFTDPAVYTSREFLQHKLIALCHLEKIVSALGISMTFAIS